MEANNISRPIYFNGNSKYNFPSTRCKVIKPPVVAICPFLSNNLSYLLTDLAAGFFAVSAVLLSDFFFFVSSCPHAVSHKEKRNNEINKNTKLFFIHTIFNYLAFLKFIIAHALNTTINTHKAPICGNTCRNSLP